MINSFCGLGEGPFGGAERTFLFYKHSGKRFNYPIFNVTHLFLTDRAVID
jgi:hypothetical protein